MGNIKKNSWVNLEKRREWLRCNEEEGETPPQIAKKESYDVRTVRKQIALAKQEREGQEARLFVMRNALEAHYSDLVKYADSLSAMVNRNETILLNPDTFPHSALREHLPNSPVWKYLKRYYEIQQAFVKTEYDVKMRLRKEIERDPTYEKILVPGDTQVIDGLIEVLVTQIRSYAKGYPGINIAEYFRVKPAENGLINVRYGSFNMNGLRKEHEEDIRKIIEEYESKFGDWEESKNLNKLYMELPNVDKALQDELAIIIHRRIIPGKCKFCPI